MTPVIFEITTPVLRPTLAFGAALDLLFFGILTVQVYIYYISFPTDRILLKLAVTWVYLIGAAQTSLALSDIGISWIMGLQALHSFSGPGGAPSVGQPDHLWSAITTSTAAVIIVIQSLYAHRIYIISKKCWLASLIFCMSVVQLATGILGAICSSRDQTAYERANFKDVVSINGAGWLGFARIEDTCLTAPFILSWGITNGVCDLLITVCMVTFLLRHRRGTMRQKTRSHITGIVQIVVETGMATTVLMGTHTFLCYHDSGESFQLTGLMMSKVYSNSMLALLNNRATISNGRNAVESFEFVEVPAGGPEGDTQILRPVVQARSSDME